MKRLIAWFLLALSVLAVVSCGGGGFGDDDEKPDAPTNVQVIPGDSSVAVTWDMKDGIEYWVFSAAAPSISTDNWTTLPQARVVRNATSPQIIAGLVNGTQYSFTVNGRIGTGPGGPGSPSVTTIPRLAGQTWLAAPALNTASLNALSFVGSTLPGLFTTVGHGGRIFTSFDAFTWTAINSGTTADLLGVTFGTNRHAAVGRGGVAITSVDGSTWISVASGTTNDLNAIAIGSNGLIAVGNGGTIVRSEDGGNFSSLTSGTTQNLYGIAFINGAYFAVGAQGTMLTSSDGNTWSAVTTGTTNDLRSIAWNGLVLVAVGANGTIITSPDGTTWTAVTSNTTRTLNSVTAGSQFVAVGAGGTIVTSVDAINWNVVSSGTTADLNAVLFGLTGFSAVGVAGVNLSSF